MNINWDDNPCFVCGMHNAVGLHAHFLYDAAQNQVHCALAVDKMWQGFEGVVHGGIIAGLLDDAMWHALYHEHDLVTMTAQLTVRYRRPVPIDTLLNIYGTVNQFNRRIVHTKAWIESFGETLVTAEGVFMPPKEPPHD